MSFRAVSRRRLLIAAVVIGVLTWQISRSPGVRPAELVGTWVATPNEDEAFPIDLREDGQAREIDIWCGGRLTLHYDWSLAGNQLRLVSPRPPVLVASLSRLQYAAKYYWAWIFNGERLSSHREILERSADTMRLENRIGNPQLFRRLTEAELAARPWLK